MINASEAIMRFHELLPPAERLSSPRAMMVFFYLGVNGDCESARADYIIHVIMTRQG